MRHEVKIVKFTKKDFLNAKNGIIEIDEWIAVEENDLLHHTQVKSIPEVHVTGTYSLTIDLWFSQIWIWTV